MEDQKITEYIQSSLDKGKSKEEIAQRVRSLRISRSQKIR